MELSAWTAAPKAERLPLELSSLVTQARDLLALGEFAGLRKRGADELDVILDVRRRWPEFAATTGVPSHDVERIMVEFRDLG